VLVSNCTRVCLWIVLAHCARCPAVPVDQTACTCNAPASACRLASQSVSHALFLPAAACGIFLPSPYQLSVCTSAPTAPINHWRPQIISVDVEAKEYRSPDIFIFGGRFPLRSLAQLRSVVSVYVPKKVKGFVFTRDSRNCYSAS